MARPGVLLLVWLLISQGVRLVNVKSHISLFLRGNKHYFLRETGIQLGFYPLPLFWTGGFSALLQVQGADVRHSGLED